MNKIINKIGLSIVVLGVLVSTVFLTEAKANNSISELKVEVNRTADSVSGTISGKTGINGSEAFKKHLSVEVYDGFNRHEFDFKTREKTFPGDSMSSVITDISTKNRSDSSNYNHYFTANLLPNKYNEISRKSAKIKVWFKDNLVYTGALRAPEVHAPTKPDPEVTPPDKEKIKNDIKIKISKTRSGIVRGTIVGKTGIKGFNNNSLGKKLYVQVEYRNKSKIESHWFNFATNTKSHRTDKMKTTSTKIAVKNEIDKNIYKHYFKAKKKFKGKVKKSSVVVTIWFEDIVIYNKDF